VVAHPVLVDVAVFLLLAGNLLDHLKALQDRAGIVLPATDIVDLYV
jgi:hypothetical protein